MEEYNWVTQMREAMKIMVNACERNRDWRDCELCPFDKYCDAIQADGEGIPESWDDRNFGG